MKKKKIRLNQKEMKIIGKHWRAIHKAYRKGSKSIGKRVARSIPMMKHAMEMFELEQKIEKAIKNLRSAIDDEHTSFISQRKK